MPRLKFLLHISVLTLLLIACDAGSDADGEVAEIPDTVSENFRQVTVSPEGRVEMTADRVETYGASDRSVFENAEVKEINAEGELTLQGGADRIEVSGNGDGTAQGSIHIHDVEGDSRLQAETLDWNNEERTTSSRNPVVIESGDGLTITGKGFVADMARERYTFTDGVEGTLELADEN